MKALVWILALGTLFHSAAVGTLEADRHVLVIAGSTDGYLSPCGCVKPMSGGIRRRITAIKALSVAGRTTVIETGGLVTGTGRQDEMKAEAVAEAMSLVGVAAINFGLEEALLGGGMAASLDRLSGGALVSSGATGAFPLSRVKASGPFLIGGIDPRVGELGAALGVKSRPVGESVKELVKESSASRLVPVLMTRGDLASAETLAVAYPKLRLIVCTSASSPYEAPRAVGETLIVTAGEHGKHVVRIEWDGERFTSYRVVGLGPEHADDKEASEVYAAYLGRVTREDLLAMVPRQETEQYAGSAACAACHAQATRTWKASAHADALATLEKDGHDRDPDCVACHVVGLRSVHGFMSRPLTSSLTDVGCESCHGPSRVHAMQPIKNKPPRVGRDSCAPCHNAQHSPGFDFEKFWDRIKH